jgi:hypothetical protein
MLFLENMNLFVIVLKNREFKVVFSVKCVIRSSFVYISHLTIYKKLRRVTADHILPYIKCTEDC